MALLGMVTNSSFLDAQTLRGVRASLLLTFDQIRILDLGGGSDLSGSTTEEISENVFDISQGVAISLGVRTSRSDTRSLTIGYRQVTGMRVDKYKLLSTVSLDRIGLIDVTVSAPNYLFVPAEYPDEWDTYLPLNHCLTVYAEGLKTGFDNGLISFTEVEIVEKLQQLADTNVPTQVLCERYRVGNRGWAHQLLSDRTRAARLAADSHLIVRFPYRPMDFRYCPWPSRLLKASSFVAGQNLMRDRNLCLVASRQVSGPTTVTHFYVSRKVPDNRIFYSTKGSATYFPLYRHEKEMQLADQGTCLAPTVYRKYSQTLGLRWTDSGIGDLQTTIGPEAFLHFCYAVFHSPTYRSIYDSALKHEFPRVPLISDLDLFRSLCTLGADLVGLHLLEDEYLAASWNQIGKESPLRHPITAFVEKATGTTIGAFSRRTCYQDGNVYLDTSQRSRSSYFKGVPKEVWNFHIGGYQVCYKWLYDRRGTKGEPGRTLTPEDIEHYQRIVVALKETIRLMAEIDEVIEEHGGWPIE
jgi:predicted helicase